MKIPPERHAAFMQIVLGGAFSQPGMASFKDVLSEQDAKDIHAYLAVPTAKPKPEDKSFLTMTWHHAGTA